MKTFENGYDTFEIIYQIKGVKNEREAKVAGDQLFAIYNETAKIMSDEVERTFQNVFCMIYKDEVMAHAKEYSDDFEKLFKHIADRICEASGIPYRLRSGLDCLTVDSRKEVFVLSGYKIK